MQGRQSKITSDNLVHGYVEEVKPNPWRTRAELSVGNIKPRVDAAAGLAETAEECAQQDDSAGHPGACSIFSELHRPAW